MNCIHCEQFTVLSTVTISVSHESLQFSCPPLRKEAKKKINKQKTLGAFSVGNVLRNEWKDSNSDWVISGIVKVLPYTYLGLVTSSYIKFTNSQSQKLNFIKKY